MEQSTIIGGVILALGAIFGCAWGFLRLIDYLVDKKMNALIMRFQAVESNIDKKAGKDVTEQGMNALEKSVDSLKKTLETAFTTMQNAVSDTQSTFKNHAKELYDQNREQDKRISEVEKDVGILKERTSHNHDER